MSSQQSDAEKKFWVCPELVKHLLSFLDLRSTLHLAKEHKLSRKTLEDKHNWKKLVDQKIPFRKNEISLETVNYMAGILKLMKTPRIPRMRELLHTICERFSDNPFPTVLTVPTVERLNIFCPCHKEPHRIIANIRYCSFGFVLLEQVERFLGTTEQRLESVTGGLLHEELMAALTSRMMRQQAPLTLFSPRKVKIDSMGSAEAFDKLLPLWPDVTRQITLEVQLGSQEIWESLARSLETQPNVVKLVGTMRCEMKKARRENLMAIWNAVGLRGVRFEELDIGEIMFHEVEKEEGEDAWLRLEGILEMTEQEWEDFLVADYHGEEDSDDEDGGEYSDDEEGAGYGEDEDGEVGN